MSLKIVCPRALLADILQFQEQSYAKEMALMGQITVELAFILGMFPESVAPCSSQLQTIAITVINSIFYLSFIVCRTAYGVTFVETNCAKNSGGVLDKLTKLWTKLKGW